MVSFTDQGHQLSFDSNLAEVVQSSSIFFNQKKDAGANPAFRSIDPVQANQMLDQHYLGSVPTTRVLSAYSDGEAVAIYGRPTTGNIRFGFKTQELMRLWSPDVYSGTLSKFLSQTIRQVRNDFQEVELLVAYADPRANHHGGIYRASNWLYAGTSADGGATIFIIHDPLFGLPQVVHTRTVSHRYGHCNRRRLEQELGVRIDTIKRVPKHTYYYPLNKKTRKILCESIPI